jgi:hypothetical protein
MEDASFKKCPFCKEKIRQEAVKCRFCGEWLEQNENVGSSSTVTETAPPPIPESIEAPASPKTENPAVAVPKAKNEISIKTLYWISGVLLGICVLVWFACLAQIPWQRLSPSEQGELSYNVTRGLIKMAIAVGIVTYLVQRKGYKLLAFSIACTICTALFLFYFLNARHG